MDLSTIIDIAKAIGDVADGVIDANGGATGSAAYDFAYVFVEPWINIAKGASQLLGMFA